MAKVVKFNIKLTVDGKEQLVSASADVRNFADELEKAKSRSSRLRDDLLKHTQAAASFQNVIGSLQQLTGVMESFTSANAVQVEAETKLANNMRNTMSARDEDIQSIMDLCSAQQALGVIGDEVQLAGAQELATYLEQKSSLEKLIPVMNDMVAQQYGLNATQESAANIATMLGKVMDGQTGALSRYGYKFDSAQEQILKFGSESERAAVLAEVVESSVGGMNAALARTDAGRAKQASNAIGDIKEQVGSLLESLGPFVDVAQEAGMALMAIGTSYSGLKGVSVALLSLSRSSKVAALSTAAHTVAVKASALAHSLWAKQLYYSKVASYAWTFGAKRAAVQAVAMRAAILGLRVLPGIGVAIAAVAGIISLFSSKSSEATGKLDELSDAAKRASDVESSASSAYTNAASSLSVNTAKLRELIAAKKTGKDVSSEEKKIVGQLNDTYGETMGYFDSVSRWYEALTANSETYCRQMVLEAKTRTLANQIAAKEAEIHDMRYDEKGNLRKYDPKKKKVLVVTGAVDGKPVWEYKEQKSELEKVNGKIREGYAVIKDLRSQMVAAVKEAGKLDFKVKGSGTRGDVVAGLSGGSGGSRGSGKSGGAGKSEELRLVENAGSYRDLANNVAYYQQELEKADITDTEHILMLARKKKAAEDAVESFRKLTESAVESVESMEEVAGPPSSTDTLGDIDAAISFYTDRQQKEDADQIRKTQDVIDGLTAKKRVLELGIELPEMRRELEEIGEFGFDELTEKIKELNKLLSDTKNPLTASQRKEVEEMRDAYEAMRHEAAYSFETLRDGWSGLKGVGDSIQGVTEALTGNGNAWQRLTGFVDGFISLYESVESIVGIVDMLTAASVAHTASKGAEGAAVGATATATVAAVASDEAAALAVVPLVAANKAATASYMELASAMFFAAHAYIPFAGFGVASGFISAAVGMVESIGAMPFAKGGIVSGPTLALVGEYPGAGNNPEVVAPLDRLRSLMEPAGTQRVEVVGRISGRDLVLVQEKEERHRMRS